MNSGVIARVNKTLSLTVGYCPVYGLDLTPDGLCQTIDNASDGNQIFRTEIDRPAVNSRCQWRRQIVPNGGVKVYQLG